MSAFTPYRDILKVRPVLGCPEEAKKVLEDKVTVPYPESSSGVLDSLKVLPARLDLPVSSDNLSPTAQSSHRFPEVLKSSLSGVNDLRTMLQMYTAAIYSFGMRNHSVLQENLPKRPDPPQLETKIGKVEESKGCKFLMKNILNEEEKKDAKMEEDASRLEVIVSSMGKVDAGHRCIYCGRVYSRKYGLKIHIRTHTGYKPLKCKICERPFGDPSNLNKHVRLHSQGSTPYKCHVCGKLLVRKRDLDRHLQARHAEQATKVIGSGQERTADAST